MSVAFEKYSYMVKSRPPECRGQPFVQSNLNLISYNLSLNSNMKKYSKMYKVKNSRRLYFIFEHSLGPSS